MTHHRFPLRVYYEDTDFSGLVYHASYLRFLERGRTEWLRALGVQQHELRERSGGMFVVSATEMKYHRPARLDDVLCVTADPVQIGKASCVIAQTARLGGPEGPLLAEGSIRLGWVDTATMQPARMPAELHAIMVAGH